MRLCSTCKTSDAVINSYCRPCRQKYDREYQKRTGYKHKKRTLNKIQEYIRTAKSVSCADCKTTYPYYVMDFDHVRGTKKFNVSFMANLGSLRQVKLEIAKCDVVCANCHRERTFKRALSLTSKTPHFDCEVIGANPVVPSK